MNEAKQLNVLEVSDNGGSPVTIGRYVLHRQIARGGMATIHIARLMGDEGFSRIVAAKRLHPEFAEDPDFVNMFLDEARVASKVHHKNVVPVLDVVTAGDEVILVQEYVHGVPLQWLLKTTAQTHTHMPVNIAVAIACQVLSGLHATHEAVDELGEPLHIVHRDVSPQNVMIATDGSARLLDFGVAKAVMAAHVTREGTYKGKLAYSAPEQLRGQATRQSDVYSLSVLLWELLVGQRMHRTAKSGAELVATVLNGTLPTIMETLKAEHAWDGITSGERRLLEQLDPIVKKGLALDTRERWATAAEMEEALMAVVRPATPRVVATWLKAIGKDFLEGRDRIIAAEESSWRREQPLLGGRSSVSPVPHNSFINLKGARAVDLTAPESVSGEMPGRHGRKVIVALLCAILAALTTAIILQVMSSSEDEPPVAVTAEPAPKPAAATPSRVTVPEAPPPSEAKREEPKLEEVMRAAEAERTPEPERREADRREVERREPVRTTRTRARVEARPEPEPPPPPPAQAQKPAVDCSTPYYFEGTKKVFKPACL